MCKCKKHTHVRTGRKTKIALSETTTNDADQNVETKTTNCVQTILQHHCERAVVLCNTHTCGLAQFLSTVLGNKVIGLVCEVDNTVSHNDNVPTQNEICW